MRRIRHPVEVTQAVTVAPYKRVVIMAAGGGTRWGNHLGVPKQLAPVNGEPILLRTIRLLKERGITDIWVTVKHKGQYGELGVKEYVPEDNVHGIDRIYASRELAPGIWLYGDCYYTEKAIDTILKDNHEFWFFGRYEKSKLKTNTEIYAIKVNDLVIEKARELRQMIEGKMIYRAIGQTLHRYMEGGKVQGKTIRLPRFQYSPTRYFTEINDGTEDIDTPEQYDKFVGNATTKRLVRQPRRKGPTGNLTAAFIIRCHYETDDPRFPRRLQLFKEICLPSIRAQTDQGFDVCVRCNPAHDEIFRQLGCKPFHVKNEYASYFVNKRFNKRFFYDFVKWKDVVGLPMYDIQMSLDSDDSIKPEYVARVKSECAKTNKSLHIHFQPDYCFYKTGKVKPHRRRYGSTGSMFFCLYYPDKSEYRFINEGSHTVAARLAHKSVFIPSGYCYMTIHEGNESSGRTFSSAELSGIPTGHHWDDLKGTVDNLFVKPGTIRAYQWTGKRNVGDTLVTPLIKHFLGYDTQVVDRTVANKLIVIGSVLSLAKPGDVVWGAGIMVRKRQVLRDVMVLATRGKLAKRYIKGVQLPDVYGDPGLLMPLVYNPVVEKKHSLGVIPHWTDLEDKSYPDGHLLSVAWGWQRFINELLSCERVVSSSLHGIILAEAYGIQAEWAQWGLRVKRHFAKFEDYLTGTDRAIQSPGVFPPIPDLEAIQRRLVKALTNYVRPQGDISGLF